MACVSLFPNHLLHDSNESQFDDHDSGVSIKSLNASEHSLKTL